MRIKALTAIRGLAWPAFCLGVAWLVLLAVDLVLPARTDLVAFARVFAPYLALLFLPLGALALLLRGRDRQRLLAVAAIGIAMTLVRIVPGLPGGAIAADPGMAQVRLATWNLYFGQVPPQTLIDALAERAPGIVGLEELSTSAAATIAADPELRRLFPYQELHPADDWSGMGLLSSWPIEGEPATAPMPPLIEATIRVPQVRDPLVVVVAHPPPPRIGMGVAAPSYDPARRDGSLAALGERIGARLDAGERVVLLGDLNLTDREVAYDELTARLTDSYRVAGSGLGHTWRPPVGDGLPFGLLRIDMVLTGPGVAPLSNRPDCTARTSDHCILDVVVGLT